MNNTVKEFKSTEEMAAYILAEVQKASIRFAHNNNFDATDLESFLVSNVWFTVIKNPAYQNPRGIHQIIKTRTLNFLESPTNRNIDVDLFSTLARNDDEGNEVAFEETFVANGVSVEESVISDNDESDFISSLSETHRRILELKVEGYNQKDICQLVYPTLAYESARKKIQRDMKVIERLATEFGLGRNA